MGDGDIFISICDGGGVTGFQGYFVTAVRIVVAPVYNGDGGTCCRVVEGVVCLVDDGGIIFHFRDLAVVSYDAVVSAGDGGWAGIDVVSSVFIYDSIGNNLEDGKNEIKRRISLTRPIWILICRGD